MGYELLFRYGMWAALILGVAGSIWWGASTIHDNIYNDGANHEKVQWQEKEVSEAAARASKTAQLVKEREEERAASDARISAIALAYAKEIEDAHSKKSRDAAAAHAGTLKLRWETALTKRRGDDTPAGKETVATTGGCNDTTRGELPPAITADLYALVNDADRNTNQLTACQKVIISDRIKVPIETKETQ